MISLPNISTTRPFGGRGLTVALGAALLIAAGAVTTSQQENGDLWLAADVLVKLIGVLALIYGSAWALKTNAASGRWSAGQTRPLRQLDSISLGRERAIHVVQAGSRTLVIGATATQISILSELGADDTKLWNGNPVLAPLSFQDALERLARSRNGA